MNISDIPFMVIFEIPIDEVKPAWFNPPIRESAKNLKPLLSMLKGRNTIPPIWLSRDGVLGDGHRRLACAKQMGFKTILAIRFDLTVEEVWAMNFGTRPITPREIMIAYDLGYLNVPTKRLRPILNLQHVIGKDGIHELVVLGVSPGIYNEARRIVNYVQNDSSDFEKASIWWLARSKQRFMVRKAIDGGIDPEILEKAVFENKRIVQNWGAN